LAVVLLAACAASPIVEEPVAGPASATTLRGVNFDHTGGFERAMDATAVARSFDHLTALGVTSVALTPSFFQKSLADPTFFWKRPRAEVDRELRTAIRLAHERGLTVMLKPHLWLEDRSDGAWRGFIAPTGADWDGWRTAYREVLLSYADLARDEHVVAFTLGSELSALARARPSFWRELARDVGARFPGLITYAANWHDELEEIVWWDAVDLIGVDAFWPLVDGADQTLTEADAIRRLKTIRARLLLVSRRFDRAILVTEIGLKSATGAALRPWQWHEPDRETVDLELQTTFYRAVAEVFPLRLDDDVRGLYLWKWHADLDWGGTRNTDFTPRGKPAEQVIGRWFGRPPP